MPIASLKEIGRRADERGVDTFLVFDTHWLSNFGFHLNANARHKASTPATKPRTSSRT